MYWLLALYLGMKNKGNTMKYSENDYWNRDETVYSSNHMIGVSEPGSKVREITLLALLSQTGRLKEVPQSVVDRINELSVVWYRDNDDIVIDYIYDHDSGEVYWDDETATKRGWSDGDELLVSSLLMFGELDSRVIG